jgi:hypothetical protein
MSNRISFTLLGLALVCSLLACTWTVNSGGGLQLVAGSGTSGTENRSVSNYTGIELGTPGKLDITIGSSESLSVEADDNLLQYIQTDVSGGRLVIKTRPGVTLQPVRPIEYHLSVLKLNSISISSSGDITVPDLKSDAFSIAISSSGNLSMQKLDCSSLRVRISSSGDASVSQIIAESISVEISSSGNLDIAGGTVTKQSVNISSSGEYRARDLASENADVRLTSSGDATLRVSAVLSGSLSSSGNINYIGSPKVNVHTSSSGIAKQIK